VDTGPYIDHHPDRRIELKEEPTMMTPQPSRGNGPVPSPINRRDALRTTLAAAGAGIVAAASAPALAQGPPDRGNPAAADARRASPKSYRMKKSINLWAFPYPQRMSLRECLQLAKDAGFDGIELNYDLENDLSPKSSPAQYAAIRKMAEEIGIAISGLCSFLYWPFSLTDNDPSRRARGLELARLMIDAAHELGTENLLTIAGSTYIPWLPEREPVPIDVCDRRAHEAIGALLPLAEKRGVFLNIETIWFNGYLTTPAEMNAFIDGFASKHLQVHFDTGNVMLLLLTIVLAWRYEAFISIGGIGHADRLQLSAVFFPRARGGRQRAAPDEGCRRWVRPARRPA
jgi:L-ribulose-5-phosphate 3-epimerase